MKTIKCYSVRVESLISISDKCYKAVAFDGSSALIPKSQVIGPDYEVQKANAYWISAWLLEQKKDFQWSGKKVAYFSEDGRKLPKIKIEKHTPENVKPVEPKADESLTR